MRYLLGAIVLAAFAAAVVFAVGFTFAERALRAHRRARCETDPT